MSEENVIKEENQNIEEENSSENKSENKSDFAVEDENKVEQKDVKSEPTMEEKYGELNDKFIRLYSEFDNYRKRSNKEKVELISTASSGVLKDILPILDDFERAISNNEKAEDINVLKEGFQLIYSKLKTTLEEKGLKAMLTKGEVFDSELHEAIANVPSPSKDLKGKIIEDVEKGYFLHEKVVRYAKVVVGQ
jgi:molecular chaperone GrpE